MKNGGGANAFPATLRGETLAALEDLFMRDRGPSLRAAYAHGGTRLLPEDPRKTTDDAPTTRFSSSLLEKGEEASEGSEGSIRFGKSRGACAATLSAAALDLCDCPASPLRGYSSVFHPRARLRDARARRRRRRRRWRRRSRGSRSPFPAEKRDRSSPCSTGASSASRSSRGATPPPPPPPPRRTRRRCSRWRAWRTTRGAPRGRAAETKRSGAPRLRSRSRRASGTPRGRKPRRQPFTFTGNGRRRR